MALESRRSSEHGTLCDCSGHRLTRGPVAGRRELGGRELPGAEKALCEAPRPAGAL